MLNHVGYTDNVFLKTGQFLPSISLFDLNTYNKICKTKNIIYFNDNLGTTTESQITLAGIPGKLKK